MERRDRNQRRVRTTAEVSPIELVTTYDVDLHRFGVSQKALGARMPVVLIVDRNHRSAMMIVEQLICHPRVLVSAEELTVDDQHTHHRSGAPGGDDDLASV